MYVVYVGMYARYVYTHLFNKHTSIECIYVNHFKTLSLCIQTFDFFKIRLLLQSSIGRLYVESAKGLNNNINNYFFFEILRRNMLID